MLRRSSILSLFFASIAYLVAVLFFGAMALAAEQPAATSACQEVKSSSSLKFDFGISKRTSMPTDNGVVVSGFVAVPGNYINGVDVSKYENRVDFVQIVQCGAKFAYVRLSSGRTPSNELEYLEHWSNARSVGLFVGPYHNITLSITPDLSEANIQAAIQLNTMHAKAQADLFLARMQQVLAKDIPEKCGGKASSPLGCPYLPAVLDASLRPNVSGTPSEKRLIGRIYTAAICSWMRTVSESPRFQGQKLMLFTFPDVYLDYNFSASDCGLDKLDIWLSSHQPGGGYPLEATGSSKVSVSQICKPSNSESGTAVGRCLFHQYTSNGMFANFNQKAGIDLNRFYGTQSELESLLQFPH